MQEGREMRLERAQGQSPNLPPLPQTRGLNLMRGEMHFPHTPCRPITLSQLSICPRMPMLNGGDQTQVGWEWGIDVIETPTQFFVDGGLIRASVPSIKGDPRKGKAF